MRKCIAIVLIFTLLSLCVGCVTDNDFPQISIRKVASIELWSNDPFTRVELCEDEINSFVELYNESKYHSKGIGVGGTPEFGATVYYKDGSSLLINEFNANYADVEVTFYSTTGREIWCYVNNPELMDYIAGLLRENECNN